MLETWTHHFMHSNGLQFHYVTQGEGPLMLMLHGFPEFWYSWRHQIPEFAKEFKVVAPDLRGYNDSDKPIPLSAYVMEEFIEDLRGLIEGLGRDRCILVGHDWGGIIAWHFAYAYSNMVERLIILNAPHPGKVTEIPALIPQQVLRSSYVFFFQLPVLPELLLQVDNYKVLEWIFKGTAVNKDAFTDADIEAYKHVFAKPGVLTAALNYYRNLFQHNLFQWHNIHQQNELEMPVLMIWAEQDNALGKELTYGMDKYIKNLRIQYVADCGHWVHQEKPELVNQYMHEFLN